MCGWRSRVLERRFADAQPFQLFRASCEDGGQFQLSQASCGDGEGFHFSALLTTSRVVKHTTKKGQPLVRFLLLEITQLIVDETLKAG
jgi:hypothetical protein